MKNSKPNLVFVFADQWRRQAIGMLGEDSVITPNIDDFTKESMFFDNAISTFPLCTPHRAALLTGKYPISTGLFTNCKTGSDIMLKTEEICIGDVLKSCGYDTGYIGKWHLDLPEANVCENPVSGARNWDAYTPPGPKRHGFDFWYSYGTFDNHLYPHYWMDTPEMIKVDKWSAEHETDVAIDYIKSHGKDKPFALFLSWNPPHSPYDSVPERYKKLYEDKKLNLRPNVKADKLNCHTWEEMGEGLEHLEKNMKDYFAAVTGIDDNFGRLLKALKDNGLDDNTIVVLSSDHGDMMGSHGLMAKHVWYEESIGIPFIIRWKDKIPVNRVNTIIESADIMPTLLGLMDVEIPNTVEGVNLSNNILSNEENLEKVSVICSCPGREIFLREFEKHNVDPRTYGWRGVRTQRYTYIINKGYAVGEKVERLLYDNENDYYQMNPEDITDVKNNSVANELEICLFKRLKELNDPFNL